VDELERLARDSGWKISEHARLVDGVWRAPGPEAVRFPAGGHERLARIEDESPWFRYRNRVVLDLLELGGWPTAMWEVGSGNGFVAMAIRDRGVEAVAIEPAPAGAAAARDRGLSSICARLEQLELPDGTLPAIGLFDVLEHLPDPEPLLEEAHRVLAPGGALLVTVPALPRLWSAADERAGHVRRYGRLSLDRLLASRGFERETLRYAFASMVLPVALARTLPHRLGRRGRPRLAAELAPRGALPRAAWSLLLGIERALTALVSPPLGTSLAARYRKPG
jgi:SAM-dependent methyltransferase